MVTGMSDQVKIVKKGTSEFKEVREQFIKLFFESKDEELVPAGPFGYASDRKKQQYLGLKSKKVAAANLPMPFGCPNLLVNPCVKDGKVTGLIYFCERVGCICVCCREDFTKENEKYPDYCLPSGGFGEEYCDCGSSTCDICNPGWDEDYPEEWEDDYYEC
jgi:hypothetical protein